MAERRKGPFIAGDVGGWGGFAHGPYVPGKNVFVQAFKMPLLMWSNPFKTWGTDITVETLVDTGELREQVKNKYREVAVEPRAARSTSTPGAP